MHALRALDLDSFPDIVITREDVWNPKPDPEIYLLAAERLGVPPGECLVLEDSSNGVRAGIAAGMSVVAFATPFTAPGLDSSRVLEVRWIVRDPAELLDIVESRIIEHNLEARSGVAG